MITVFLQAIAGKPIAEVMAQMDELMQALFVVEPRLYASVMRKFEI